MTRQDFYYKADCKDQIFTNVANGCTYKITNKSNYCVFYKGEFVGDLKTKKDAEKFIDNLIKYNKLTYTQEYRLGGKIVTAEEYNRAIGLA